MTDQQPIAEKGPRLLMAAFGLTGACVAISLSLLAGKVSSSGPVATVVAGSLEPASPDRDGSRSIPLAAAAIRNMSAALERSNAVLRDSEGERIRSADLALRLDRRLDRLKADLDAVRGRELGRSWRIDRLQQELDESEVSRDREVGAVRDWLGERTTLLMSLLSDLGVDHKLPEIEPSTGITALVGSGGPYEPYSDGFVDLPSAVQTQDQKRGKLGFDLERLQAAEDLLARLPLAEPLDYFHITSAYGRRTDPLTRSKAIHRGLDMAAARGSKVLATAAGRVIEAGWAGAYGIMVAVDHGSGIVTRYGHLQKLLVSVGDRVDLRQPLGIIGSTGRSTGIHLHYEILVDDRTRNPYHFLNAGRNLMALVRG